MRRIRRYTGIALDHSILHFDGTTYGVDHTAKFNEGPVAGERFTTRP